MSLLFFLLRHRTIGLQWQAPLERLNVYGLDDRSSICSYLPSKLHIIIEKTLSDRHAARFVWSDFSYSSSLLTPQFVCSGESDIKWCCGHHALLVAGFCLRAKKTLLLSSSVRRATPRGFSAPPAMFYRHSFASRLCSIVELHFRPRYSTPKKSLVRLTNSSSSSTLHWFLLLLSVRHQTIHSRNALQFHIDPVNRLTALYLILQ